MNSIKRFLIVPLLLLATLFAFPITPPSAHAATTGLVCIADASSSSCPSSPPTFTGPVGSPLTVAVNIQNSNGINCFDVSVRADPTILSPKSIDLTGSLLHDPRIILVTSVNATSGVTRSAVCGLGYVIPAPATGHLFSISYNIIATTTGTTIDYQTGCPGSSNDSFCVIITNPSQVPENLQTASFNNHSTFSISISPSSLSLVQDSSGTSTITLTSINGFMGSIPLKASIAPLVKNGPSISLSPKTIVLTSGGSSSSLVKVDTQGSTPTGSYTISVTMSGVTVTIPLTVTPKKALPDFSISASPASLTVMQGSTGSSTITVTSLNGFAGSVGVSVVVSPNSPALAWGPTPVTLVSGGTATISLTVFTSSTVVAPPGSYVITATGTSGLLSHSTTISLTVTV